MYKIKIRNMGRLDLPACSSAYRCLQCENEALRFSNVGDAQASTELAHPYSDHHMLSFKLAIVHDYSKDF